MIDDSLQTAGFTNISNFNNGQEAWDYLDSIRHDSDLFEKVNLIVTDIEMPEMDGEQLGADEQLTKPEIGNLVHVIDKLLERFERMRDSGAAQ